MVAVVVRDAVVNVLLATDRTDAEEDRSVEPSATLPIEERLRTPERWECILPVSVALLSSAFSMLGRMLARAVPPRGTAEDDTGPRRSSGLTSISAPGDQMCSRLSSFIRRTVADLLDGPRSERLEAIFLLDVEPAPAQPADDVYACLLDLDSDV